MFLHGRFLFTFSGNHANHAFRRVPVIDSAARRALFAALVLPWLHPAGSDSSVSFGISSIILRVLWMTV
jgi:hypothetical protein